MTDEQIREIFMAHGFTIKEGQTDLKPYVYAAARALLSASKAAAPFEVDQSDPLWPKYLYENMKAAHEVYDQNPPPAAPAQSAEPVAWVYDFRSSLNVGWKEEFSRLPPAQSEWVRNIMPLLPYAAPQPAQTAQSGEPVEVTAVYRASSDCQYVGATEEVKCAWADGWNQCAQYTKGSQGY